MNDEIMAKILGRAKKAPPSQFIPATPSRAAAEPPAEPQAVVDPAPELVVEPVAGRPEPSSTAISKPRSTSPGAHLAGLVGELMDLARRIPPAGYRRYRDAVTVMLKVGDDEGMTSYLKETREALKEVSKVKPWDPPAGRGEGGAN